MTPDTSGRLFEMPWAVWDPASSSWRTYAGTSHSGSKRFSGTWPTSGSMRDGACYEHPTWGHPTSAPASSSLRTLPTPTSQMMDDRTHQGGNPTLAGAILGVPDKDRVRHERAGRLLPTPRASEHQRRSPESAQRIIDSGSDPNLAGIVALLPTPRSNEANGTGDHGTGGPDLRTLVDSLLPTPTSRDHKGRNQRDDTTCLPGAIHYLPSIGDLTDPPSNGGKPSTDPHQPQLPTGGCPPTSSAG